MNSSIARLFTAVLLFTGCAHNFSHEMQARLYAAGAQKQCLIDTGRWEEDHCVGVYWDYYCFSEIGIPNWDLCKNRDANGPDGLGGEDSKWNSLGDN